MADAPIRKHVRLSTELEVHAQLPGTDGLTLMRTRDFGVGGCFLVIDAPPPRGTRLELVVSLVEAGLTVAVQGEVRHTIDAALSKVIGATPGMGIEFVGVDPAIETSLRGMAAAIEQSSSALDVPEAGFERALPAATAAPELPELPDDMELEPVDDMDTVGDAESVDDPDTEKDPAVPFEPLDFDAIEPVGEGEDDWEEEPRELADTHVKVLSPEELHPIDDDTNELLKLEPVGHDEYKDIILALRNEASRLQGATFEDRIGIAAAADKHAILGAHRLYIERYHRDLFKPVDDAEIDRLVAEIHELARAARDGLVARASKAVRDSPSLVPNLPAPRKAPTDTLLRAGLEHLAAGHNQQARDVLSQAHRQDPTRQDVEAAMHLALGSSLKQYGRLEQAMSHFKKAAELDPGCMDAIEELRGFNLREDRKGMRILNLFRKKRTKGWE